MNVYKLDSGQFIVATYDDASGCYVVPLLPEERTPGGTHSYSSARIEDCANHTTRFSSSAEAGQQIEGYLERMEREPVGFVPHASRIIIPMSERAPLKIAPEDWRNLFVRYREDLTNLQVREHADGRRIVYGRKGENARTAGFLVEWPVPESQRDPQVQEAFDAETIRAIRRVAGIIGDKELADECIASMPPRELT